jgi:hypothetical protein
MVEYITRLIIQEQKEIPVHRSMTRLTKLIYIVFGGEEEGSVRILLQSVEILYTP